jgi:alpha-L-rhamnosidase
MSNDSARHVRFTRRRLLQAGALAGAATTAGWSSLPGAATAQTSAQILGKDKDLAGWFANPGRDVRPRFRWWWPDAKVDPAEIRREVDQIADAGFGGAEIAAVHHSIKDKSVLGMAANGWGTPAWNAAVEAALDQAAKRGITIDITLGPSWPAAVPTITADSPAAVRELAYGTVTVAAGAAYRGPVPAPAVAAAPGVTVQKLILVQAVRVDTANSTRKETGLDAASVQDLTGQVADGQLSWTAPADGQWVILSYWERGSGQRPESDPHTDPLSYVVDHFSRAGTQAVIDFWEANLLTPRIRKLLKKAGGALFEDSIELETDALNWTPALPAEFERRRGYPLHPYLPVIVRNNENPVYSYEAELTRQVRHDFWETVSDLFNEHHFTMLRDWAHTIGMGLRAQPYGLETDAIASAAILDVPEGESLGFKNLDDYRALAGGRDMAGRIVLSCEAGAYQGGAYNTTWEKFLRTMGGAYAAGLNQTYLHGFSYASAPGVNWPGYAAFTPYNGGVGYSESWGPRHPTWRHVRDVSGYLSRVHQVMQAGTVRVDVAVFRQKGYTKTGIGANWFTASGIPLGWTHQFLSAPLLDLPSAAVSGGRLAPGGPGYKALFVEGDLFAGGDRTLPVAVAEKLLGYTRAGLSLIFLGDWSVAKVPGVAKEGENERLRTILAELFAQPKVRVVADKARVGEALAELGLRPDVMYAQSSTLLNARRVADGVDYYYLCNGKHAETVKPPVAAIDHEVSLTRTTRDAVPYRLDLWTGQAERIATYTEDGDRVRVRVALQPSQAVVVALGKPGLFGTKGGRRQNAVTTTADEARFVDGELMVRDTQAGSYQTVLSNGRTVTTVIEALPEPMTLTTWRLEAEDWKPGASATETAVATQKPALDALKPWPQIPELADVSGIGRYTAVVELGAGWTGGHGAYLELGEVFDTCRVTVNGRRLPPVDLINPVVDLGSHLRRGRNTIEVEVATTLNNRLRVADPGVYGGMPRQNYGLIGPVRLVPYGQARVSGK